MTSWMISLGSHDGMDDFLRNLFINIKLFALISGKSHDRFLMELLKMQ
jgi:hypothetical protein